MRIRDYWSKISCVYIQSIASGGDFELTLLTRRSGFVCFRVSGSKAIKAFSKEAGGHRWQRVPPTERKGRVHTSTITVAVLPEPCALFEVGHLDHWWWLISGSLDVAGVGLLEDGPISGVHFLFENSVITPASWEKYRNIL